ncbi:hypothetical protein V8017_11625 [Stenotrophomonas rhizophila]
MKGTNVGLTRVLMAYRWAGKGYLAGDAPVGSDPDAPDGRFKILNQPSVGRIVVLERTSMIVVAMARSTPAGIWRVRGLNPSMRYMVLGIDDRGLQNAAVQDWVLPAIEG